MNKSLRNILLFEDTGEELKKQGYTKISDAKKDEYEKKGCKVVKSDSGTHYAKCAKTSKITPTPPTTTPKTPPTHPAARQRVQSRSLQCRCARQLLQSQCQTLHLDTRCRRWGLKSHRSLPDKTRGLRKSSLAPWLLWPL